MNATNDVTDNLVLSLQNLEGSPVGKSVVGAIKGLVGNFFSEGGVIEKALTTSATEAFGEGIDSITGMLSEGFEGARTGNPEFGWSPLNPDWIRRKRLSKRELFWINKGHLLLGFRNLAVNYKRELRGTKAYSKLSGIQYKGRAVNYKYNMKLQIPPSQHLLLTSILRDAFFSGVSSYRGDRYAANKTIQKLGYLEVGTASYARPFIARTMSAKGALWKKNLQSEINRLLASAKVR